MTRARETGGMGVGEGGGGAGGTMIPPMISKLILNIVSRICEDQTWAHMLHGDEKCTRST